MVIGQIFQNRFLELVSKPREKDRYVMDRLGISERTLNDVRGSLDRAAKILGDLDPKFVTTMNLAALIYSDWDDPVSQAKRVHYQLERRYRAERESFLDDFGFRLPYIEFLRQEVTGRKLNCLKVREKYKKFEVSREDIQRNVSIPDINHESCVLLAGYWGRASLKLFGEHYAVQLSGGKDDFNFYENWVKGAIWRVHNLEVKVESVPIEGYQAKFPRIWIASKAIATWLRKDLGFSKPKENVSLPNIEWNEERKQGFFDGIIAFMGGSLGKWGDIALHDHDLRFIGNLHRLARELGYTPKVGVERFEEKSHSYRLYFSPKEVKGMNLINPKHRS